MSVNSLGRLYQDGEAIVRQGEPGMAMYVIQQGKVEVIREGPDHELRLAVLGRGEFFGEMSLFEKHARSATVRSLGTSRVLTIDKRTLIRRIREDPYMAFNMLRAMSKRIRALNEELHRVSGMQSEGTRSEER